MWNLPLPSDLELEKRILWYLIIYWKEAEDVFIELEIEYFSDIYLKKIAEILYEMVFEWKEIDLISLNSELKNKDFYEKIWWLSFLVEITSETIFIETIFTLVAKLRQLYQKRELIKEARKLENIAFNSENIDSDVSKSFENISEILNEWVSKVVSLEDSIESLKKTIEENKKKELVWYSWWKNFEWLNEHTWWIRKWKTYRIAWTSWAWKTSVMYEVIYNLLKQNAKVLFLSLENDIETTITKFASTVQGQNPRKIEKWDVGFDEKEILKFKNNLKITDQVFNLNELKREILKSRPDVVVLDYIGLVEIDNFSEETKYNKYADEIKVFMQRHKSLVFIDLSNLTKADTEETIRQHWSFNWSQKLKNNTDFWMHIFWYKPFSEYKKYILENGDNEAKKEFLWKKVLTFLITKNRLWDDWIEKQYLINFDKWIRFLEATEEQKNLWKSFNW